MEIIEISKFLYTSALPVVTFLALIYIIYLLLTRRSYFKKMEQDFQNVIQDGKKRADETIDYINTNIKGFTMLANLELENNLKKNTDNITLTGKNINNSLDVILKKQDKLDSLQKENERLKEELKKRDVFVERKNQQISRMKQKDKESY